MTVPTKSKEKLRKIKSDQDMILDYIPSFVFFKDKDNRYIRVNKAFADFIGISKKELEGKSAFDFYPKKQANSFWEDDKEVIATRVPKKNIIESIKIKKTICWLEIEKVPHVDEQGNTIGIICFAKNITEKRYLEVALHSSEIRFRRLFETAQDGILILDAKNGQIKEVNQFLIDMLGYSHEEFLQKKLWEVNAFTDVEKSKKAFELTQKKGSVTYENIPLQTKDGLLVKVEFVNNLYTVNHHNVIQCNIRNITDRKNIELAKENRRLLREEKARIYFMAEASHELRTPLAIIKGTVDIILRESQGKVTRYADDALHDIDEEVKHLMLILSDLALLTTTNSEIRKKVLRNKINFKKLLNSIIKRYSIIAAKKNITIRKKVTETSLIGDQKYLEKLLLNLIKNAISYGRKNGWVYIEVIDKKNEVLLRVSDNGIGIVKEDLSKIFSRFYRVDKTHAADGKHTGLGLAISKRVVEAHGGVINVRSDGLGKGSTFIVSLPKNLG